MMKMKIEPHAGEPDVARFIAQIRGEPVDQVPYWEALVDDEHEFKLRDAR